jgi:septal ring factor EnvC (AmiA/AmiB activator)
MIRAAVLGCLMALGAGPGRAADAVTAAQEAADALTRAASLLAEAGSARNRVAALTETVRAYEDGLEVLRDGMRQAALRERAIRAEFGREEEQLTRLVGALLSMQTSPESLVLLHPDGPLANARAGMIVADVTPAINMRVSALRAELDELETLRTLQEAAGATLQEGLDGVQEARAALSHAISDRSVPEDLSASDAATLQALVNSADTLQGFAATLTNLDADPGTDEFAARKGTLPAPATGVVVAGYNRADASGTRRPGVVLATAPLAVVTAPHAATVRYSGPLLDLGMVVILEPEAGFLLILSGLAEVFPVAGEVLDASAPVGLMGGRAPDVEQILIETGEGSGQSRTETLYIELRQGENMLDPGQWFELAEDKDKT